MASLRKRVGTQFWFACFTDPGGRRVQRSTKTADRKLAAKIAAQWEDVANKRATEAQTRRVLSDIHEQIHGSPLSLFTVQTYADQWLGRKKGETRAVTYTAYNGAIQNFLDHLEAKKDQSVTYLTPAVIAAWRDASAAKATPRTANNKLKILRVCLQDAWRDGLLPDGNPAAKVKALEEGDSKRRPFTIPEIKAVLKVATDEWKGMVLAGLYTGQRLRDLAGLTWSSIDLQHREIRLQTSKTKRRQFIPIAKPLMAYLMKRAGQDDPKAPVFESLYPFAIKSGGSAVLSAQFHELLSSAGIVAPRSREKRSTGKGRDAARENSGISFHSLRHSATSLLKKAGVSEAVAMDLIGHDSAAMSANYTHTDAASRRAAVASLPDVTK